MARGPNQLTPFLNMGADLRPARLWQLRHNTALVVGEVEQRTRLERMQQPDCRLCEAAKWANTAADPRAAQQHDLRDRGFGNDRPGFGLDLADCARGDR